MSDSEDETDAAANDVSTTTAPTAGSFKVHGKLQAQSGAGVVGYNTATTGTPIGVEGAVEASEGYGLSTPDDARVTGSLDTTGSHLVNVDDSRALELGGEGGGSAGKVLAGYSGNTANGTGGVVGGGGKSNAVNDAFGEFSTVAGGLDNYAQVKASVGGGENNIAQAQGATIGGGFDNEAAATFTTIGGGIQNDSLHRGAAVGGGEYNRADARWAAIAGGGPTNELEPETSRNEVLDNYGAIGGGGGNQAGSDDESDTSATYATVGGGETNTASGTHATVGGGLGNDARSDRATIGGGGRVEPEEPDSANVVYDHFGTIGGGGNNQAGTAAAESGPDDATFATVGGGEENVANGAHATVGGGDGNTASGICATVPGGENNTANGQYSFAVGRNADDGTWDGAFVVGDSTTNPVSATVDHEVVFQSDAFRFANSLPAGTGESIGIDTDNRLVNTAASSARYKRDIEPLDVDTEPVLDLEPRSFTYEETGDEDVGFVAESVEERVPGLVVHDDEGRPDAIRYDRLGVYLQPAVRENRERSAELQDALEAQCDRIDELAAENERLHDRVDGFVEENERLHDRVDELVAENERLRDRSDAHRARNEELEARLDSLERRVDASVEGSQTQAPADD